MSRPNSPSCPSVLITQTQTVQGIIAEDNLHVSLADGLHWCLGDKPKANPRDLHTVKPTNKPCNRVNNNKGATDRVKTTAM